MKHNVFFGKLLMSLVLFQIFLFGATSLNAAIVESRDAYYRNQPRYYYTQPYYQPPQSYYPSTQPYSPSTQPYYNQPYYPTAPQVISPYNPTWYYQDAFPDQRAADDTYRSNLRNPP